MTEQRRPLLLVEDSDADAVALERIARRLPMSLPLVRVRDGESALEYLYQRGDYADAVRPALVLLDLHMPGMGGREVLSRLKADPALRCIPIIIFSSSKEPRDVEAAARALQSFWLSAARLPGGEDSPA